MKKVGFTLIEVMLVAGILSVALLVIARIFPLGLKTKHLIEEYSIATLLGQEILEKIKERGYDALSTTYPSRDGNYGSAKGEFEELKEYFWEVEWWDTEIPSLRKVRVRVFYRGKEENSRKYLEWFTYIVKQNK